MLCFYQGALWVAKVCCSRLLPCTPPPPLCGQLASGGIKVSSPDLAYVTTHPRESQGAVLPLPPLAFGL